MYNTIQDCKSRTDPERHTPLVYLRYQCTINICCTTTTMTAVTIDYTRVRMPPESKPERCNGANQSTGQVWAYERKASKASPFRATKRVNQILRKPSIYAGRRISERVFVWPTVWVPYYHLATIPYNRVTPTPYNHISVLCPPEGGMSYRGRAWGSGAFGRRVKLRGSHVASDRVAHHTATFASVAAVLQKQTMVEKPVRVATAKGQQRHY